MKDDRAGMKVVRVVFATLVVIVSLAMSVYNLVNNGVFDRGRTPEEIRRQNYYTQLVTAKATAERGEELAEAVNQFDASEKEGLLSFIDEELQPIWFKLQEECQSIAKFRNLTRVERIKSEQLQYFSDRLTMKFSDQDLEAYKNDEEMTVSMLKNELERSNNSFGRIIRVINLMIISS